MARVSKQGGVETAEAPGRLEDLQVADIMTREVVTVSPESSVAELVSLLLSRSVTGVPVVGADGLVGVVSASDVLRLMAGEAELASGDTGSEPVEAPEPGSQDDPVEALSLELLAAALGGGDRPRFEALPTPLLTTTRVADIMTSATFAVAPETSVRELASFLVRGNIHRTLVVRGGELKGIVTSSDIARAVAGQVEGRGT